MLVTYLLGVAGAGWSIRLQVTEVATRLMPSTWNGGGSTPISTTGPASTFFETNTRPVEVAAHAVDVSSFVRSTAATAPPARSPQAASVSLTLPSSAQSPHCALKLPVHSLQTVCASAIVLVPRPAVFVR